jgi:Tfp pilus assembly protein PilO
MERSGINILIAAAVVVLASLCLFKFLSIQRVNGDIARLEIELSRGQELWKGYPPLSAAQRKDLEATERRLFQMLPREKEIPAILEEIAGLARNNNLVEISFAAGDGAAPGAPPPAPAPGAAVAAQAPGAKPPAPGAAAADGAKPIESIPITMAFSGDHRGLAMFLEGLKKLSRLVTVQSLSVKRGIPLLTADIVLHAYYQKGELPPATK